MKAIDYAQLRAIVPGLVCSASMALLATLLAPFAPILGAPVIAIVLGVAIRAFVPLAAALQPGVAYGARTVLQGAIVVSGFAISLVGIFQTGLRTLPVTFVTIAVALTLAPLAGRILRIDPQIRELVGIGTAICGASAIAAVSAVIEASTADVALAVATIFFYNIVAVVTFPLIGHLLALSQSQFGIWAGTAINDTSSVVAAGFAYGHEAGVQATIVKLTRATLILPIVAVIAALRARAQRTAGKPIPWRTIVPWFIVWFLAAALVNTIGIVPAASKGAIAQSATFLISTALAAIGLQTVPATLVRAGLRPLVFGLVLWLAVAFASLGMQRLTGL